MNMPDLYKSEEWKSLDKVDRTQFLLVIEGIKRGTLIEGKSSFLKKVFRDKGLEYWTSDERLLYTSFFVAKPDVLLEMKKKVLENPQMVRNSDFQRRTGGWFYGYPDCCIDSFTKMLVLKDSESQNENIFLIHKFYKDLETVIKKEGKYPDIFDYRPTVFTPCRMECEEAVKFLKESKQALETLDPEATQELVFSNRHSYPMNLVHEDYLTCESEKRALENKLEFIRKSIGKYN
jgi:hypothetical protein